MDRVQRLTAHLDIRNGTGLEIGPLANPVVRPAYGQVFYADHVSTEELRQKYATDASIDKAALMEISYVWAEKSLAQTCEGRIFDYVVASHVFEHTPDPISWLREIAEVLKTGGRVVLAIPDKRYTFDYRRTLTTFGDLIETHLDKRRRPSARQIFDSFHNVSTVDVQKAWDGTLGEPPKMFSLQQAVDNAIGHQKHGTYCDVHCTIVTPRSFLELMVLMAEFGLLDFICVHFLDTAKIRTGVHGDT